MEYRRQILVFVGCLICREMVVLLWRRMGAHRRGNGKVFRIVQRIKYYTNVLFPSNGCSTAGLTKLV